MGQSSSTLVLSVIKTEASLDCDDFRCSSSCAPTCDNEVRPNSDNDLDDRDAMMDYFCLDLTKEQMIEANEICELLLALGVDVGVARTIVAGLLSLKSLVSNVQRVSGDALDLKGVGRCWIFTSQLNEGSQ